MKNIVVYNVPEGSSNLKEDNVIYNSQLMTKLSEHAGKYQPNVLQVRRLGSKQTNETETHETRNRPFPDEDKKALVVKNLNKLKNKGEPFSGMTAKHDMSKDDKEKERSLKKEPRENYGKKRQQISSTW